MATLYDGYRSFNAVKGATAWPRDPNKFQDDTILGLEERTIPIPIQLAYHSPAETSWTYFETDVKNPPYWDNPNNPPAGESLLLPIPYLPSDTQITEIVVEVDGTVLGGDANQGVIELIEQNISGAPVGAWGQPAAGAVDIGGATPWVTGGATANEWTSGALTFDVVGKRVYAIAFVSSIAAAAREHFVYSAYIKAMFHKGT